MQCNAMPCVLMARWRTLRARSGTLLQSTLDPYSGQLCPRRLPCWADSRPRRAETRRRGRSLRGDSDQQDRSRLIGHFVSLRRPIRASRPSYDEMERNNCGFNACWDTAAAVAAHVLGTQQTYIQVPRPLALLQCRPGRHV